MNKVLCNVILAMVALAFLAGCGGRSTYKVDGYHSSTAHRGLRDNPTHNYPPGYYGGSSPEEQGKWAEVERRWAQAEAERARAAREWHRTDREAVARGGGWGGRRQHPETIPDAFLGAFIGIIEGTGRGASRGFESGVRRGIEDGIRGR